MNFFMQYNARTVGKTVRMKMLMLALLLVKLVHRLYPTNPAIKVLRIFKLLVFNSSRAIDLSIEYIARTILVIVIIEELIIMLTLLLLCPLFWLNAVNLRRKLLRISGLLVFRLTIEIDLFIRYNTRSGLIRVFSIGFEASNCSIERLRISGPLF